MAYTLPQLGYGYDALSQSISADIMELHHSKHHQTYVDKLNTALESAGRDDSDLKGLLAHLGELPEDVQTAVRNNGGGHFNHSLFWQCMSPNGGGTPAGDLRVALEEKYGEYQKFVDTFSEQAAGVFGSGWVWLQPDLTIMTTPNQDSPVMRGLATPILGLDVWEHAYYLDYQNKRADYIKSWWDVVDWQAVAERYQHS